MNNVSYTYSIGTLLISSECMHGNVELMKLSIKSNFQLAFCPHKECAKQKYLHFIEPLDNLVTGTSQCSRTRHGPLLVLEKVPSEGS